MRGGSLRFGLLLLAVSLALPCAALANGASYQTAVLAASPTSYWTLAQASAPLSDAGAGGYTASATGGATLGSSGPASDTKAVSLDGSSGYLNVPYTAALNPASNYTIEAWVDATGTTGANRNIVTSVTASTGYNLNLNTANQIAFCQYQTGGVNACVTTTAAIAQGSWHQVAASVQTISAGNYQIEVYLDGVGAAQLGFSTAPAANATAPLRIGANSQGGKYFYGNIAHVSFYPSVLSASTIASHYSAMSSSGPAPTNSAAPVISGTATAGQTLSVTTGSWTGSPTSYSYQWQASTDASSWADLSGATASSYTLTTLNNGYYLRAKVTATNSGGSAIAYSAASTKVAQLPPVNTTLPIVSGSAQVGQLLSSALGTWTGTTPLTYTYQWQRSADGGSTWANISGAAFSTYTPASADLGDLIRLNITASNSAGTTQAASMATVAISAALPSAPVDTTLPTLSGSAQQGQLLSASTGSWSGTAPIVYSYQWQSSSDGTSWSDIAGATSASYTATAGDIGNYLRVEVTGTNAAGSATAASAPSAAVTASGGTTPPSNSSPPTISGSATVGQTLNGTTGSWSGSPTITYTYQWQSSSDGGSTWANVAAATSSSYTIQPADSGNELRLAVTATNGYGNATAYSAATSAVGAAGSAPSNSALPTVSGSAQVGNTLTASTGSWSGSPTITYAYQWQSSPDNSTWSNLSGATGSTYNISSADTGNYLRIEVAATNAYGSASADSAATAQVTNSASSPPSNTSAPVLSGVAQAGNSLTVSTGSWSGSPTITYAYQWQSSPDGSSWTPLSGATAASYSLSGVDVGNFLRVAVTATNPYGSSTVFTSASAQVAAAGVAPAVTANPAISGTAQDGQALITNNGSWSGTLPIAYAYQWQESADGGTTWSAISGATSSSYVATSADVGDLIRVQLTASNAYGSSSAFAASVGPVAAATSAPLNSALPTLSGAAQDGQTLSGMNGTWSGTPTISYSYQWQSSSNGGATWSAISGATTANYNAVSADVGNLLRLGVTATNAYGSATAYSAASGAVTGSAPLNTVIPSLTGTAADGQILTATTGVWSGTPTIGYAYQWQSSADGGVTWAPISGSTSPSYTIASGDIGNELRVAVTASNGYGAVVAYSTATTAVTSALPIVVAPPTISGSAQDEQTLAATTGSWTGSPTISFGYQWQTSPDGSSSWSLIVGANSSTYTLQPSDIGNYLRVAVSATNSAGSAAAYSVATAQISGALPSETGMPTISGTAQDGQTLSGSDGAWSGSPTVTYSYQWQEAATSGGPWSNIVGATTSSYTLTPADLGEYLRFAVTGANGYGAQTAYSNSTAQVGASLPVSVLSPTISGSALDGATLTTSNGGWSGTPTITFNYQWQSSSDGVIWTPIAGATGSVYVIPASMIGNYLRSSVIAVNGAGNATAFSAATAQVGGVAPASNTPPTITGSAADGQTLSATSGSWSGSNPISYTYQWQNSPDGTSWSAIAGATTSSYTASPTDVGDYLRVAVTASSPYGSTTAASATVGPVSGNAPVSTAAPAVSGNAVDGQMLNGNSGSWSGTGTITYSYQWQTSPDGMSWANLSGATGSAYTLQPSDIGNYLRLQVTATNSYGSSTASSSATAQVAANPPANSSLPVVSGTAQDGQTLSASTGSWSGSPTITYSYQWQSSPDGATSWGNLSGATSSSYTVQPSDIDSYLRVAVSATNGAGSALADSFATSQVIGNSPASISPPSVSGSALDGQTVSGTTGSWSGSPTITYSYQWQDATASSGPWADVAGQTASSLMIPAAEIGNYLRLQVTASNSYGSQSAASSALGPVGGDTPSNAALPLLSGSAIDGGTITTSTGSWSGSPTLTYSYQWQTSPDGTSSWADIAGATTGSYTVSSADVGNYLRAVVTATNPYGNATADTATSAQVAGAVPVNTSAPSLSGSAVDGQSLSALTGSWSGSPTITYSYQWQTSPDGTSSWVDINGATTSSYTATSSDIGNYLRAVVTATNGAGSANAATSGLQVSGVGPSSTAAPSLSGSSSDGQTLTGSNGSWSGSPTISYSYQWQDSPDGTSWANLSGATAISLTVPSSEIGNYLRLQVTATNPYGNATASSAASTQVTGNPPGSLAAPSLSGSAQALQILTSTTGSWSGSPTITYSYQWQTSPDGSSSWTDIAGATAATYTVQNTDIGNYLRAVITATNPYGGASASSSISAQVTANAPVNTALPSISGSFADGNSVSGTSGSWNGSPTITYSYQWQTSPDASSWADIAGATTSSLSLVSANVGKYLRLCVTASNSAGSANSCSLSSPQVTGAAPLNTLAPVVSGTVSDGQTVTATTGSWSGTPTITYSYQWQSSPDGTSSWSALPGATSANYTVQSSDVGDYLRVAVTATNGYGNATADSAVTVQVSGVVPTNTAIPTVSGTASDGQTLTATTGTWTGTAPITYSYQWQSSSDGGVTWANISGATASSYTVQSADVGNQLRVDVKATNGSGNASATSTATSVVTGLVPSNTALPTLSGSAQAGQLLSGTNGTWTGTAPISYSYQWQTSPNGTSGWTNIVGATTSGYVAASGDVGNYLRLQVTATNAAGSQSALSAASAQVTGITPANTSVPTISGSAQDSQTLSAATGTWTGTAPISYSYQWQTSPNGTSGWTSLIGATASSYIVQSSDIGNYLRVAVTGSNSFGNATANSSASAQVSGQAPSNTVLPSISGIAQDGQSLSAAHGTWIGSPTIAYSYQWQTSPNGTSWSNLGGAITANYTIQPSDISNYLRVQVTASNPYGSVTANSAPTAQVAALLPSNTSAPTISGSAQDGQTLTSANGSWTGSPTIIYSYQWQTSPDGATWSNLSGATSSSYTVQSSDIGNFLRLQVTATNSAGAATANSASSAKVVGGPPVVSTVPTISGVAQDGQVLSSTNGSWTGSPTITYSYQWEDATVAAGPYAAITGATSPSYTITSAEIGKYLRLTVTASNGYGNASSSSTSLGPVVAIAPANTVIPVITGTAKVSGAFSATSGTWTGSPTISYSYQWQRCDPTGASCANISAATSASYTAVSADLGSTLRVAVSATNSIGTTGPAYSNTSDLVVASSLSIAGNIGTVSSKGSPTSLTVTLTGGAAVGQWLVIDIATNGASGLTAAVSDSKGNSYGASDGHVDNLTSIGSTIVSALVTKTLAAGDTITVTFSGGTPSSAAAAVSLFNGVTSASSFLDGSAQSGTGNSTAAATAALVTSNAADLLLGDVAVQGPTGDTFTAGASWTALTRGGTTGNPANGNATADPEYRIVSSTGSYTATATVTSRKWAAVAVAYKTPVSKSW